MNGPNDAMTPGDLEAELRTLLASEREAIADGGFSDRVLVRLPRKRFRAWTREAVILGMTILGCVLALIILPGGRMIQDMLSQLPALQALRFLPVPWLLLVYICSSVLVIVSTQERSSSEVGS